MKTYERQFELSDIKVRRLVNGCKLRVVLELPYNQEIEKQVIELRNSNIKVKISDIKNNIICNDKIFSVFDIKVRKLANGDRLSFILENLYTKETELEIVGKRFDDIILTAEVIEEDLFQEVE